MRPLSNWIPLIIAAVLAALLAFALMRTDRAQDPMVGQTRPALQLTPLDVAPDFAAADTSGARLVNFWASWCAPCIIEHPQLMQLASEGFVVEGYVYRDEPSNARAMLARKGNPFAASYLDPDGVAMMAYGTKGVPESFVIDKDGVITLRITGVIDPQMLSETLRPALVAAGQ